MKRLTLHFEFDVTFSPEISEDWAKANDYQKAYNFDNWQRIICSPWDEPANMVGNIKVFDNGKELDSLYDYFQKKEGK